MKRNYFALTRLVARGAIRSEQYAVSAWIVITAACYLAALLPGAWVLLALPLALLAVQILVPFTGSVLIPLINRMARRKSEDNRHANAVVFMALMIVASAVFAAGTRWQRYAADAFLAVVIANAVAAAVEDEPCAE